MKFKKLILIALVLIIVGFTMITAAFVSDEFGFDELYGNINSKTYDISGEFDSIDAKLNVSNLNLYLSSDETNKAVCLEKDNITFNIEVKANTLIIEEKYKFQLIDLGTTEISLYLSKSNYDRLKVETDTGDISISDKIILQNLTIAGTTADVSIMNTIKDNTDIKLTTGDVSLYKASFNNLIVEVSTGEVDIIECIISNNVKLTTDTGDVEIYDTKINEELTIDGTTADISVEEVECNLTNIKTTTGNVELSKVVVTSDMNLKTNTGDVKLNSCDALNITIETTTGDVSGSLLSEKIFITKSDTGEINVPETMNGGKCKVTTDTGDIDLIIK